MMRNKNRTSVYHASLLLSFLLLLSPIALGQTLESLAQMQQAKLENAIQRLNTQRKEIQAKQIPLAREFNTLNAEAKTLRGRLAQIQAVRDSKSIDIETLQKSVDAQQKEYDYITRTLFSEYLSFYQTTISAGEQALYGEALRQLNLFLDNPEGSEKERLNQTLELIKGSFGRIEHLLGGKIYPGEALDFEDKFVSGQFIQAGPLLYFAGQNNDQTGWVEEMKSLQPRLIAIEGQTKHLIRLAQKGEGLIPVDSSLGSAIRLKKVDETLGQHLSKGGIWVYPIIGFALIATLIAIYKAVQIFTIREPRLNVVHDIIKSIREEDHQKALQLAEEQPYPASGMLAKGVNHANESVELIEEMLYESMLDIQPKLERFLNIIAVTAAVAPLLGLLGTVTGIIKTFNLMSIFGAGDPRPLISGISEALITTELGLILAIPALVIHALLSRRVSGVMARLEKTAMAFINGLSRKTLSPHNALSTSE